MPGYYLHDIRSKEAKYFSAVPDPEQATVSLLFFWLLGYCILIAGANLEVSVTAIFAALTTWMLLILYAVFVSIFPKRMRKPKPKRRTPIESLLGALKKASKKESNIEPHGEFD